MLSAIRHRGPDDYGVVERGAATLGHARLSIIDLSENGHQPMSDSNVESTLLYNGELYNFQPLAAHLGSMGVRFKGHSDTEVVLQAYNKWGLDAFRRFEGMFALAIWDERRRRLVLARDRFGIKPLYYAPFHSGVVFGSEIKSLLASGYVGRDLCPSALHEYMWFGNALGSNTIYRNVFKLPPASTLVIDSAGASISRYWDLETVQRHSPPLEECASEVARLLEEAVRSHLVADVPVGVFLSGGVDSSAVATFASRHYAGRIDTFSAAFDFSAGSSELPMARRLAGELGTAHHEIHVAGSELPQTIEALVRCHDEPFGDAANIPLYLLARALGGTPKVILQGDGGDEIFAGYRRHNVFSAEYFWRSIAPAGRLGMRLLPRGPSYYQRLRFLDAMSARPSAMRMALMLTQDTLDHSPVTLLSSELQDYLVGTDPFARYRELGNRFSAETPLQRMLYTDTSILLPDTYLEKVDKPTMSMGIEVRVPFLDNRLTDYVLGLPASYKIRRGHKKYLLRRALRGVIPDYVLDAPKRGFSVPFETWLRGPLVAYARSVFLDDATRRARLFNEPQLRTRIAEHVAGKRNNGFMLWKALQLALWHREYITGAAYSAGETRAA
jgi:asparagine synthase (glutamine-hydrolysing)